MAGPKLFDMGRAPIKESLAPSSIGKIKPNPYSYEHKVVLNADDLSKLGVGVPKVGDKFHVLAEGHVMSTDQSEAQNGTKAHNVHLQLKKMAIQPKGKGSLLGAVGKGISDAGSGGE